MMKLSPFLLMLLIIISCNRPKSNKLPKEVERVFNTYEKEKQKQQNQLKENHDFSEEIIEIIEWYDYKTTLMNSYKPVVINSSEQFTSIVKNGNPEKIIAINFKMGTKDINLSNLRLLKKFKNLEYIETHQVDSLPKEIYSLKKLKVINCFFCELENIDGLTKLTDLEHLELKASNYVLPADIDKLAKLKTLRLTNRNKKQPYKSIYNIPNLETLWIQYSDTSQLKGIGNLKKLKTLSTNQISSEASRLANLNGLIIFENYDSGYPIELSALKNLKAFRLNASNKIESAPYFITNLENLEYIEIRGCNRLKSIPDGYNNLKMLKQFDILYCDSAYLIKFDNLRSIKEVINVKQ